MGHINLDKTDLKILHALQDDGRLSNVELADRVALSPSPCLRRLKALEDNGVVKTYAALLSPVGIGLDLQVLIRVATNQSPESRQAFSEAVQSWSHVLSCYALTGESDYLLHAFFPDMAAFSHFILDVLLALPYVEDAKSSFVLKEVKNTTKLPLDHL